MRLKLMHDRDESSVLLNKYLKFKRWLDEFLHAVLRHLTTHRWRYATAIVTLLLMFAFRLQPMGGDARVVYMVNRWTGTITLISPRGYREVDELTY